MTQIHTWQTLTSLVLDHGVVEAPRNRPTLAVYDVTYEMDPDTHFDSRKSRELSLNYVFREFLWFCRGNRFDIRMANYAPIWKTCIQNGAINSNYGQYLFNGGFESPFCRALMHLAADPDSRRCWLPIFQVWHQDNPQHEDYPCTTGMGFSIRNGALYMKVHMRSQDLWWGAANDEPVCYLIQLLAKAYLETLNVQVELGGIIHHIDNLHLYERHWSVAHFASQDFSQREDVLAVTDLCHQGFLGLDLEYLLGQKNTYPMSPLLEKITDIPGAYSRWDH